jgi:hypothetical protein
VVLKEYMNLVNSSVIRVSIKPIIPNLLQLNSIWPTLITTTLFKSLKIFCPEWSKPSLDHILSNTTQMDPIPPRLSKSILSLPSVESRCVTLSLNKLPKSSLNWKIDLRKFWPKNPPEKKSIKLSLIVLLD